MNPPTADTAPAPPARRASASDPAGWLLAPLVLVAALLRFHLALRSPLWFEELYVMLVARRSAAGALWIAIHDIHPPIPFLLRHALVAVGGDSPLAQKSLSIALSLLALPLAWRLVRRLFDARVAALATALMAVSFALVRYGQEVGMFSMQWLLALALVDTWTLWLESGRRRDAVLGVAIAIVAVYTHYVFLAVEPLLFAWGLLALRRDRKRLAAWAGMHALVAIAFVPQAPIFLAQVAREMTLRYSTFPTGESIAAYARFLGLHHRVLEWLFPLAGLLPLLDRTQRRAAILMWLLVLLPPLSIRVIPLTFPTEFLFAAPFAYALVAAGLDRAPLRPARLALCVLIVANSAWWSFRQPPFHEPVALQQELRTLRAHRAPGDLVLHSETHSLLFALYYDPAGRNRILVEDAGTQYFDGGLVIPDSARMTRSAFAAARSRGDAWWAFGVNRARVARNVISRAGAAEVATFDSLAAGPHWVSPPVTLWQGLPEGKR